MTKFYFGKTQENIGKTQENNQKHWEILNDKVILGKHGKTVGKNAKTWESIG